MSEDTSDGDGATTSFANAVRERPLIRTETEMPDGREYVLWWEDTELSALMELEEAANDDPERDLVDDVLDRKLVRDDDGNSLNSDDFAGDIWKAAAFRAYLEGGLGLTDDVISAAIDEHVDDADEGNG